MWISEMQIEHDSANINKGSRSDHKAMARPFDLDSDEFNTILLASLKSGNK